MSRADEIREKAQKYSAGEARVQAYADTDGEPPEDSYRRATSTPKPRVKPVRRTVDLSPEHHRQLDAWCFETARELGLARITGQHVLRTLVAELLRDETTARKVRKALSEDQ